MRVSFAILIGTSLLIAPMSSESLAQNDPHSSGYAGPPGGYGPTPGKGKQMKYVPDPGVSGYHQGSCPPGTKLNVTKSCVSRPSGNFCKTVRVCAKS